MQKAFFPIAATLLALGGHVIVPTTASAGMYVAPAPIAVGKPKPVRQPPKVVPAPKPRPHYYRPPVVVSPPVTQPPGGVTVITKPRG